MKCQCVSRDVCVPDINTAYVLGSDVWLYAIRLVCSRSSSCIYMCSGIAVVAAAATLSVLHILACVSVH